MEFLGKYCGNLKCIKFNAKYLNLLEFSKSLYRLENIKMKWSKTKSEKWTRDSL